MKIYSVRKIVELVGDSRLKKKHRYEERITIWNAVDFDEAILKAEAESKIYGKDEIAVLTFYQAFELFDKLQFYDQGLEIFSLVRESDVRESDLDHDAFIERFFENEN